MTVNNIFNITICSIGIAIFLSHIVNLLLRNKRRKDENRMLLFLSFTAFHFLFYLIFAIIKINYTSDIFIKSAYTTLYIFNNVELLLLFLYMLSYVEVDDKVKKSLLLINYSLFTLFIIPIPVHESARLYQGGSFPSAF